MIKEPKIPMTPEEVPQQRLGLVTDLPRRPLKFNVLCDFNEPMPDNIRPKGSPRNFVYLGSVEWAWSPMHSRFDSYYLNPRGSYWLLWIRYQDFNTYVWPWYWRFYAYAKKNRVCEKIAATYMLMDAWTSEKQTSDLDHYFLVDDPGLLSMSEISEIARQVWPENYKRKGVRL